MSLSLIFSGCSPPAPGTTAALFPGHVHPAPNTVGARGKASVQLAVAGNLSSQVRAGHTAGHRSPQWTGPQPATGSPDQNRAGQAAAHTEQPELLSSSLCLCQPWKRDRDRCAHMWLSDAAEYSQAAPLGSNVRHEHAARQAGGDCGLSLGLGGFCHYPAWQR